MHSLGEGVVLQQGIRTVAAKTGRVSQSQPAEPGSQFCSLLTIAPGKFAQLKFSNFEIRTIALRTRSSRRNMYGTRVWAFSPSSQPLPFPLLKVVFSSLQRGLSGPCRKKIKLENCSCTPFHYIAPYTLLDLVSFCCTCYTRRADKNWIMPAKVTNYTIIVIASVLQGLLGLASPGTRRRAFYARRRRQVTWWWLYKINVRNLGKFISLHPHTHSSCWFYFG